jgi:hypothetical protein
MPSSEEKQAFSEAVAQIAEALMAQRRTDTVPWPDLVLDETKTEAANLLDAERVAIDDDDPAKRPSTDVELTRLAMGRVIEGLKQPG